jgi:hypothetical protein
MKRVQRYCSPSQFAAIADDPRLSVALRLARTVNALRALSSATRAWEGIHQVHPVRQATNALLFLGATLYEALEVVSDIGPLANFRATTERLVPFRRDTDLQRFKRDVLKPLRNQFVFHFDPAAVSPAKLATLRVSNIVFESHESGGAPDFYYELADFGLLAIELAPGDVDGLMSDYQGYIASTLRYAEEYCVIIDALLLEVTEALGFTTRFKEEGDTTWT